MLMSIMNNLLIYKTLNDESLKADTFLFKDSRKVSFASLSILEFTFNYLINLFFYYLS